MDTDKAPPIGIVPEIFHQEERLRNLAGAIDRYISDGFFGGNVLITSL